MSNIEKIKELINHFHIKVDDYEPYSSSSTEAIIEYMKSFVQPLKSIQRKIAAEKIAQAYGQTNRAGMLFKLLDGKSLSEDDLKKLIFQVTKS